MRRLGGLVVLLALWATSAEAGRRAQLVTPTLERRLDPGARRNLRATVAVEGAENGSGVVLDRRRGLIVTNAHVAAENPRLVHTVDGTAVPVREVIHAIPGRDVAFLRVGRLPRGTTQAVVDPGKPVVGRKVYAINSAEGFLASERVLAGEHEADPRGFVRAHRKTLTAPGAPDGLVELARHMIASQGNIGYRIFGRGRVKARKSKAELEIGGETYGVSITETNLPHASGASGGGVFAADSDALVAVHTAGTGKSSAEIPIHRVVGAARKSLANGDVKASKTGVAALQAWLAAVSRER